MTMRDAEYNCNMCKNKYARIPDRQKQYQTKKGCFETYPNSLLQYSPNHSMKGHAKILYNHCPARFFNAGVAGLISYNDKFQSGIMPFDGGYYEQPAKFVEIMDLVHNLINEYKSEQQKTLDKHGRKRSRS